MNEFDLFALSVCKLELELPAPGVFCCDLFEEFDEVDAEEPERRDCDLLSPPPFFFVDR